MDRFGVPTWTPGLDDAQQDASLNAMSNTDNDAMQQQQQMMHGSGDVKPRLTKEQHDILEREFQKHNKPSTLTKKGYAEKLGVPLDKINVSRASYLIAMLQFVC